MVLIGFAAAGYTVNEGKGYVDVRIWKNIQSDVDISFFLSTTNYGSASGK